jgi:integrase
VRKPSERLAMTKRLIQALEIPEAGRRHIYDSNVRELGLRIEASGRKSFFWFRKVQGRGVFKSLGNFPATSIEEARGAAHTLSGDLDRLKRNDYEGKNPFDQPRGEPTLGALLDDYIERHIKQKKGKTKRPEKAEKSARYMFDKYLAGWCNRKLSMIRRKDVIELHAKIGDAHGPYVANRIVQLLRTMFNHAADVELSCIANPARRISMFHEIKRKRFVQENEMPKLFAALKAEPNPDVVDYVCLCLWTGARRSDILSARWQDIVLDDNRWDVPDPKGEPYTIALAPEVITIFRNRLKNREGNNIWVFPSFGRTGHIVDLKSRWKELLKRAGIENLRQHDLRRTYASWQAKQGTSLQIVSKSLGHASTAATEIYSRLDLEPVRESVTTAVAQMVKASKKKLTKQLSNGGHNAEG